MEEDHHLEEARAAAAVVVEVDPQVAEALVQVAPGHPVALVVALVQAVPDHLVVAAVVGAREVAVAADLAEVVVALVDSNGHLQQAY